MNQHPTRPSNVTPLNPQVAITRPAPRVRYEGFENIEGGRRLTFSVKSTQDEAIEIAINVSHALFKNVPGISFQDAAPMAYEKIVSLLASQELVESSDLRLTDADVQQYIYRHLTSQKRTSERRRRSHLAA